MWYLPLIIEVQLAPAILSSLLSGETPSQSWGLEMCKSAFVPLRQCWRSYGKRRQPRHLIMRQANRRQDMTKRSSLLYRREYSGLLSVAKPQGNASRAEK